MNAVTPELVIAILSALGGPLVIYRIVRRIVASVRSARAAVIVRVTGALNPGDSKRNGVLLQPGTMGSLYMLDEATSYLVYHRQRAAVDGAETLWVKGVLGVDIRKLVDALAKRTGYTFVLDEDLKAEIAQAAGDKPSPDAALAAEKKARADAEKRIHEIGKKQFAAECRADSMAEEVRLLNLAADGLHRNLDEAKEAEATARAEAVRVREERDKVTAERDHANHLVEVWKKESSRFQQELDHSRHNEEQARVGLAGTQRALDEHKAGNARLIQEVENLRNDLRAAKNDIEKERYTHSETAARLRAVDAAHDIAIDRLLLLDSVLGAEHPLLARMHAAILRHEAPAEAGSETV